MIQGNRPYDGRPAFFLIACIIIAVIALIILIVKICRYKKKKSPIIITILTILLLSSIGGIIFIGVGRKAKNDDIYIELKQDSSLCVNVDIYSYEDITNLEILFQFRDKDGKLICAETEKIIELSRNQKYSLTLNLNQLSFSEKMQIDSMSANVIDGRTSYI